VASARASARALLLRTRARLAGIRPGGSHERGADPQVRLAGPRLIAAFGDAYRDAVFVEIGANDGVKDSYLREQILAGRWRGVMVEPVPYVFERLQRNYAALDRIALENAAIADRDGELPFFHLAEAPDPESLPDWYDEIGSFKRDAVLGHRGDIPDIDRRLVEATVPCLTFDSLCRKHGIGRLDLVLIDAEGYDAEILAGIGLEDRHPRLLVYEHYHLTPAQRDACRRRVHSAGYETLAEGFNTWCFDPRAAPELAGVWRGLEPGVPALTVAEDRARRG
jgi:FkbM family methyltransferase